LKINPSRHPLSYKSVLELCDVSAVPDGECHQAGLRFRNISRLIAQAD